MLCLHFGFWERFWSRKLHMLRRIRDWEQRKLVDLCILSYRGLEPMKGWLLKRIQIQCMHIMSWVMRRGFWSRPIMIGTNLILCTIQGGFQWRREWGRGETKISVRRHYWMNLCLSGLLLTLLRLWRLLWCLLLDIIILQLGMEKIRRDSDYSPLFLSY